MKRLNRNRLNSTDDIALRGSIAGWWSSLLTAVILTVAVKNLFINTKTLAVNEENLENTKRNAGNTAEMINQLKSINQKLERINHL